MFRLRPYLKPYAAKSFVNRETFFKLKQVDMERIIVLQTQVDELRERLEKIENKADNKDAYIATPLTASIVVR
jgi:hypothetical protein